MEHRASTRVHPPQLCSASFRPAHWGHTSLLYNGPGKNQGQITAWCGQAGHCLTVACASYSELPVHPGPIIKDAPRIAEGNEDRHRRMRAQRRIILAMVEAGNLKVGTFEPDLPSRIDSCKRLYRLSQSNQKHTIATEVGISAPRNSPNGLMPSPAKARES